MKRLLPGIFLLFATPCLTQTFELVRSGKTSQRIIIHSNADSNETKAARALQKYINAILEVKLIISTDARPGGNIFIGQASPLHASLVRHQYAWQVEADNLHIGGATPYQTLETVYLLLEEEFGCKFLSPDAEYIPHLPSFTIKSPGFSYDPEVQTRTVHAKLFYNNPEFAAKRRVTTEGFPGFVPEARVHTFHRFIPEKQYYREHPEFYALVKGKRLPTQLCLSNDTVYRMIRDSVAAHFARNPASTVISVSQDDNTQYCTCPRCTAKDQAEGTPAASMLLLVNRIAREFPERTVSTLAYQYTRKAPRTIKPEKNVLITLCSIECDRSAPIAEKCKDFESDLKEWGALGSTIQIWDYTTQFTNFLAPFPNLETLKPNIELFVANNANWIFEQHSHNTSDLYEMRCWIMSKLLWNPSLDYDALLDEFCQGYYGNAGAAVKQYVTGLHDSLKQFPSFFLFLYGDPAQGFSSWLSGEKLKRWNDIFNLAEQQITGDTVTLNRLHAARMGLDFATLEFYRLNKAPYRLSEKAAIDQRLRRFERSTQLNNVQIINEMGLPRVDYLNAYRSFLSTADGHNLAHGAAVALKNKPVKYANEDPQTLTDGAFGGWSFYANWLGFLGDLEATIDLGQQKSFRTISINFLQVTNHVVFYPVEVEFEISGDGKEFRSVSKIANPFPLTQTSKVNDILNVSTPPRPMEARFIRIRAKNMGTPPYWDHAAGSGAWIFADEVVVR